MNHMSRVCVSAAIALCAWGCKENRQNVPLLDASAIDSREVGCPITASTPEFQYVVSDMQVPTNPNAASQIALDLDGVEPVRNDNQLGILFATLASQADFDIQRATDEAVATGDTILLMRLQTDDVASADCARVSVLYGTNPNPPACSDDMDKICRRHLAGDATFDIDPSSPQDPSVDGTIASGGFVTSEDGVGTFSIDVALITSTAPIRLDLFGARVEISSLSEAGLMSGILAGAITQEALDTEVVPYLHQSLSDAVAADCAGTFPNCCVSGSTGETILNVFNTAESMDCVIALNEITENALIMSLLAPDVDLLDESGIYDPGSDGVNDSLSIGIGFTAVSASF